MVSAPAEEISLPAVLPCFPYFPFIILPVPLILGSSGNPSIPHTAVSTCLLVAIVGQKASGYLSRRTLSSSTG